MVGGMSEGWFWWVGSLGGFWEFAVVVLVVSGWFGPGIGNWWVGCGGWGGWWKVGTLKDGWRWSG